MALSSISLNNGATVLGRMLARNGQVSLINNVLNRPSCATGSDGSDDTPARTRRRAWQRWQPARQPDQGNDRATARAVARRLPRARTPRGPGVRTPARACTAGFRAAVRGHLIARVVFRLDGKRISSRANSPFRVYVKAAPGQAQSSPRASRSRTPPAPRR